MSYSVLPSPRASCSVSHSIDIPSARLYILDVGEVVDDYGALEAICGPESRHEHGLIEQQVSPILHAASECDLDAQDWVSSAAALEDASGPFWNAAGRDSGA